MFDVTVADLIDANIEVGESGSVINQHSLASSLASVSYYDTPLEQMASVVRSIMQNHPFVDGNKRTGVYLLRSSVTSLGLTFKRSESECIVFAVKSVTERWTVEQIVNWVL